MTIPSVFKSALLKVGALQGVQLKVAALTVISVALLGFGVHVRNDIRESGKRELRDSLANVREVVLTANVAAAVQLAADEHAHAIATAEAISQASAQFTVKRQSIPARVPLQSPIVMADGDSVHLRDSTHFVPHAIAEWMGNADRKMAVQDSLMDAASAILEKIPLMRQGYETTIAQYKVANVNLDSLVKVERGRRESAEMKAKPSLVAKAVTALKVGGLLAGAFLVGKAMR